MDYLSKIDLARTPKHIAIIMDGNGRWAKKQGHMRLYGHNFGVESVRETLKAAKELKVKNLTLYELQESIELTKNNTEINLILALNYSARWEMIQAVKKISELVSNERLDANAITNDTISSYLSTAGIPDPELLIRTSGEHRVSNFLLWQIAYTEFHFTDVLWPDFKREDLYKAVLDYQSRERRFGMVSEQLT